MAQLSYGLRGQIPDGMLVRVSSIDPDAQAAYLIQQQFIVQMFRAVPAQMQSMVFGQHVH